MASRIPDATLVVLDSINHTPLYGEPAFDEEFAQLEQFLPPTRLRTESASAFDMLTAREREILELIARGMDNMKIAAWCGLAEKTVRNHVSRIFTKIAVEHRGQAIVVARDAGLGH